MHVLQRPTLGKPQLSIRATPSPARGPPLVSKDELHRPFCFFLPVQAHGQKHTHTQAFPWPCSRPCWLVVCKLVSICVCVAEVTKDSRYPGVYSK